jgi:hypothetical protein
MQTRIITDNKELVIYYRCLKNQEEQLVYGQHPGVFFFGTCSMKQIVLQTIIH